MKEIDMRRFISVNTYQEMEKMSVKIFIKKKLEKKIVKKN